MVFVPALMKLTDSCESVDTERSGSVTMWYLSSAYTCSVNLVGVSAPEKPMRYASTPFRYTMSA